MLSLADLSEADRATRYRQFAAAALLEAAAATTAELRVEYVEMATRWHRQAVELERF